MHPDQTIVRMDRWSYGWSTIPDNPDTLTSKSAATYNTSGTRSTSPLHGILPGHCIICATSTSTYIPSTSPPTLQFLWVLCYWVKRPPIDASVIGREKLHQNQIFVLIFVSDSIWFYVSNLIQLAISNLIQLSVSDLIFLSFYALIWLPLHTFIFDSGHTTA